jgi:hypothetical protein
MAKILTIEIPDDLEQALTSQAERLNKSPEEVVLELLSRQLPALPPSQLEVQAVQSDEDPLLKLIGSIHVGGINDLSENHDYYIGQALYREMHPDE